MTKENKDKISRILDDVATVMIAHDAETPAQVDYNERDIQNVAFIFMHVISSPMFKHMTCQGLSFDAMCRNSERLGKEIHDIVNYFTGVDLHKIDVL